MSHPLTKIMVAKAQLVTALDLFIRDKDPISVQCLACGGGEVVEALAEAVGKDVFATHILQTQPGMDRKAVRALRNQYWNAFKHFSRRDGIRREDEDLLHRFDDKERRRAVCRLVDYAVAQKKLPVAVQVFQVCWCAINEEKLSPDADISVVRTAFPGIRPQSRTEQKRRLRRASAKRCSMCGNHRRLRWSGAIAFDNLIQCQEHRVGGAYLPC